MTNFTIKVSLDVDPPLDFHDSRERTHEIPPDYELEDRRRLYAVKLESLADEIFEELGWFQPLRHALLANAARLSHIEELIEGDDSDLAEAIRATIEEGSQESIQQWGEEEVEGDS